MFVFIACFLKVFFSPSEVKNHKNNFFLTVFFFKSHQKQNTVTIKCPSHPPLEGIMFESLAMWLSNTQKCSLMSNEARFSTTVT